LRQAGIDKRRKALGETLLGLQELLVYGLKVGALWWGAGAAGSLWLGNQAPAQASRPCCCCCSPPQCPVRVALPPLLQGTAAYAHHADVLGANDPKVYAFVQEAMWFLSQTQARDADQVCVWGGGVGVGGGGGGGGGGFV